MEEFDRNLRKPEVCALVGVGPVTLWRMVNAGEFPAPFRLSKGLTAWPASQIKSWLEEKRKDKTVFPPVPQNKKEVAAGASASA